MLLLGLFDIPTWFVSIGLVIFVFYLYTSRKHSVFRKSGIPAIKPAPFLGGLPQLKKGVMQCEYDATMEHGKVVGFFLGNLPTVFLTEPDIIKELFVKRFTDFPSRSTAAGIVQFWEKTILLSTDFHYWRFLRTIMTPSFTSGKLRKMDELVTRCINRTIQRLEDKVGDSHDKVIDMVPTFRGLTLEVICQSAMGVDIDTEDESTSELRKQVSELLCFSLEKNPLLTLLFLIPDIGKLYTALDIDYNNTKAIAYIQQCLKSVIQERKNEESSDKQDLLQLMINSQKQHGTGDENGQTENGKPRVDEKMKADLNDNGLDPHKPSRGMRDDEIIANSIMFLFAGFDTTSTALIFTSYFLATQPDYQEQIVQEIDEKIGTNDPDYDNIQQLGYLDMFVSESMRIYPPVTRINRQITQATTIGQYTFPANISVTCPVYTLHRLPEFWPEPEKFDPERFSSENKSKIKPYTYLPFGAGPRNCLGMRFANMELKMSLVKLLQKFIIKPSPELQIPPKLEKNVFCRPVGGMKLIIEKRVR